MADDDPNLGNAEYMEGLEALRNLAAFRKAMGQ